MMRFSAAVRALLAAAALFPLLPGPAGAEFIKKTEVKVENRAGKIHFKLDGTYDLQAIWIDPVYRKGEESHHYNPHYYDWDKILWGVRYKGDCPRRAPRVPVSEIYYGQSFPAQYETPVSPARLQRMVVYSVEIFLLLPGSKNAKRYAKKIFYLDEKGKLELVESSPKATRKEYTSPMVAPPAPNPASSQ